MKNVNCLAFLMMSFVLTVGCSIPEPAEEQRGDETSNIIFTDEEKLLNLGEEIENLIKDKSCGSSGSCNVIGFGSKACGGPISYLVYSSDNVDEVILKEKVRMYNDLQNDLNKKNGVISDCALAIEPNVNCVNGECKVID